MKKMTVTEYQEFVKNSPSFKEMDPIEQQRILSATGADMEGFIKIFKEEEALMKNAVTNFYEKSEKVVKDFNTDVKEYKKVKNKVSEFKGKKEDEKIVEKLLDNLDKI